MASNFDNDRVRKLLRSHPEAAVNLLAKKYWHTLVFISKSFTGDFNSAKDIVQETFAHLWEKHRTLSNNHEKTIDNYLVQVVRYKSISYYKKTIRLADLKHRFIQSQPHTDEAIEAAIVKQEIIRAIRDLIATFPPRERQCLEMKVDQELTNAQIASHLNITQKAVERSITSAYKRLRKHASLRL